MDRVKVIKKPQKNQTSGLSRKEANIFLNACVISLL